jgi:hypothetical protein
VGERGHLAAALRAVVACAALAAASLFVGAGCSSTGPKDVSRFTGTWTFSSGSFDATCPGLPPLSNSLAGEALVLAKGSGSDLTSTLQTSFGTCVLRLSADGTMASATPGQSCMFTVTAVGSTFPVTLTVTSWTVVTADGTMMVTTAMGAANGASGLITDCPVTVSGTATKGASDASTE